MEAIGEAAGGILRRFGAFAAEHPELELVEACRARNRLSHGCDTIDRDLLWYTATLSVPRLVEKVRPLMIDNADE